MLTRRLNTLVDSGLLERRLYSEKPPRYEYVLTPRGQDFRPVLWTLVAWGNKHFPPEGQTFVVVDAETGEQADPVLVDSRSGRVLRGPEFEVATVPAAGTRIQHSTRAQTPARPPMPTRERATAANSDAPTARRAKPTKVRTSS
jgi:hypothetical protein